MKKSLLIASLLVLSLVACGKKEEEKPIAPVTPSSTFSDPVASSSAPVSPTVPTSPTTTESAKK